jgi:hypothetical protein
VKVAIEPPEDGRPTPLQVSAISQGSTTVTRDRQGHQVSAPGSRNRSTSQANSLEQVASPARDPLGWISIGGSALS